MARVRVLALWNQVEEDVYERIRAAGPYALPWNPTRTAPDVGTVAEEMDNLLRSMRGADDDTGYDVTLLNVANDLDALLTAVRDGRPDVVFNLVEFWGEDASHESWIAGLFELLGVPYTGAPPGALLTCQDKHRTKLLLADAGLPTPRHVLIETPGAPALTEHRLRYPLIVKPVREDASSGIELASVVHDHGALAARVAHVIDYFGMPALVEEYIHGREIQCALLGNAPPEPLPLFEMAFQDPAPAQPGGVAPWRPRLVTYGAKWDPHSPDFYAMDAVCPAPDLEPALEAEVRRIAVRAFEVVGARDYARVDMRLDQATGAPYVLEVNPNPDLGDGSAFLQCAVAGGRSHPQVFAAIIEMARARGRDAAAEGDDEPADILLREHLARAKATDKQP